MPRFFYGDVVDEEADEGEGGRGCGVLVLEDLSTRGFRYTLVPFQLTIKVLSLSASYGPDRTHDCRTMLLDLPRMEAAVSALAEFHALSNAFQQSGEGMNEMNSSTNCDHPYNFQCPMSTACTRNSLRRA